MNNMQRLLGKEEVEALLPHRSPILLIDAVWDYVPGKSILVSKWLGEKDPVFQGHFPGFPIMPGVLLLEAGAQSAALLLQLDRHDSLENLRGSHEKLGVLGTAKVRFLKPVFPKTELWIQGEVEWFKGYTMSLKVEAGDNSTLFMTGSLIVTSVDRNKLIKHTEQHEAVSAAV